MLFTSQLATEHAVFIRACHRHLHSNQVESNQVESNQVESNQAQNNPHAIASIHASKRNVKP